MAIKLVPDVVAPLSVAAVNIVTKAVKPTWQEWIEYGIVGAGYLGAWMGWGGDFVKNVAIAEVPSAAEKLYDRVKGAVAPPVAAVSRVEYANVSRRVSRSYEPEFQKTGVI